MLAWLWKNTKPNLLDGRSIQFILKRLRHIFSFFKKKFNEITKDKDKAEKTIQKLTKTKQDLEIKIASKTKVYGLTTYQSLVQSLTSRIKPAFVPSGVKGGKTIKNKTIKNKTRKNKRKKYITKRQRTNNKKSIRKNRKNNKKHITKHKW